MSTTAQPSLFDPTSAAERIGARITGVPDESVRGTLWAIWVLAVHSAAEPAGMGRNVFFRFRIVPLINRLDPASTVYVGDRWKQEGYPPQLKHDYLGMAGMLWALRQLAFGDEAAALTALEGASV